MKNSFNEKNTGKTATFYAKKTDLLHIQTLANNLGISIGELIRRRLLDRQMLAINSAELLSRLDPIGTDISQIRKSIAALQEEKYPDDNIQEAENKLSEAILKYLSHLNSLEELLRELIDKLHIKNRHRG
jgi:hypothetical protein